MGIISITIRGSFVNREDKSFSAMHGGHTQAVAEAINYLSGEFLSDAIKQDHMLHEEGNRPDKGFGQKK